MIYGGAIKKGFSKLLNKDINISTCYEASGAFNYNRLHAASGAGEEGRTPSDVMDDIERHACPGAGAVRNPLRSPSLALDFFCFSYTPQS
jgi:dihydroxy-acid dehydratase